MRRPPYRAVFVLCAEHFRVREADMLESSIEESAPES